MNENHSLHAFDQSWAEKGYVCIAGTDEAGRGPLAGPVVAGAVILPVHSCIPYLNDSKKLSALRREAVYLQVLEIAEAVAWSAVDAQEIDAVNIYQASRLAMMRALAKLDKPIDLVLSDAMPLPEFAAKCVPLVGGDGRSACIAAASVVAKVVRDRMMDEWDECYPCYGFRKHKGYGTPQHMAAIAEYGPCPLHRRTFEPVKSWGANLHEN